MSTSRKNANFSCFTCHFISFFFLFYLWKMDDTLFVVVHFFTNRIPIWETRVSSDFHFHNEYSNVHISYFRRENYHSGYFSTFSPFLIKFERSIDALSIIISIIIGVCIISFYSGKFKKESSYISTLKLLASTCWNEIKFSNKIYRNIRFERITAVCNLQTLTPETWLQRSGTAFDKILK